MVLRRNVQQWAAVSAVNREFRAADRRLGLFPANIGLFDFDSDVFHVRLNKSLFAVSARKDLFGLIGM